MEGAIERRKFLQSLAAGPALTAGGAGQESARWNILVVVSDTLRTAYLGPYGNKTVKTPTLDRLARESTLFERAHAECLPTIPTRRTLHSGRRAFPFRNYRPLPWDNVYLPGWQPMSPDEDTVAEALARSGYHTGFVADVPHYFVPGQNFTRGFHQWDFVRGNAEDRYRSTAPFAKEQFDARYRGRFAHVANLGGFTPDEMDFATPRTFTSAMRFLEENRGNPSPFYLYVDTFHPHETWEAPRKYYEMYRDPNYRGQTWLQLPYSTLDQNPVPEDALANVKAHYSGLVTMVDHWLGRLLEKLAETGKDKNTLVFFVSDHGTNFADNLEKVTGKPAAYLYPGTMDIPLLIRHPQGKGAGRRFRDFVYTLDVPATVCAAAGTAPRDGVAGINLLPLLEGGPIRSREYLTCRYGNFVWYTDAKSWYFSSAEWNGPRLFDLEDSRPFSRNIAGEARERVRLAQQRILHDAGGELPIYEQVNRDRPAAKLAGTTKSIAP